MDSIRPSIAARAERVDHQLVEVSKHADPGRGLQDGDWRHCPAVGDQPGRHAGRRQRSPLRDDVRRHQRLVSIAIVIGIGARPDRAAAGVRLFFATGILGGYTTFSTFSLEALSYWTSGLPLNALVYVGVSLALGIAGAAAGILTARAFAF